MNPFLIPGEANPVAPLRPWRHPEHNTYYVPIDNTHHAFGRFQEEIDFDSVPAHGRFVVVTGQEGCGKTALVNRCTNWLKNSLADTGLDMLICDFTLDCRLEHAVDERMSLICRRLMDELKVRRVLTEPQFKDLNEHRDKPNDVYPYLSAVLEPNLVVVILLPSAELVSELVRYASLVRPKIVFFAESPSVDGLEARRAEITRLLRVPPIELNVGPLRPDDGWLFASDRLNKHAREKDKFPGLSKQTMQRVTRGGKLSIKKLQEILCGVYKERLRETKPGVEASYDDITYADITDYVFREIADRRRSLGR